MGVVRVLLHTVKVAINAKVDFSRTLLLWAASRGHQGILKLLLGIGRFEIKVNSNIGRTLLCLAAEYRLRTLLDC